MVIHYFPAAEGTVTSFGTSVYFPVKSYYTRGWRSLNLISLGLVQELQTPYG